MMQARNRTGRAVAVVTVGVTTAMGVGLTASGAQAAPESRPAPAASAYGLPLWSTPRVPTPPPSMTALHDAMAGLRLELDGMRATIGQRVQTSLDELMKNLAASLPPGVTLPDPPDLSTLGVTKPATQPDTPAKPAVTPPAEPAETDSTKPADATEPADSTKPADQPAQATDATAVPKLELRRTADQARAVPGDTVAHTVTVKNAGGAEAKSAVVRNALPAGVKLVESKPSQGEFDTATGVWKTGAIKAGSEATLILVLKVPAGAAGSEMIARSSFVTAPGAKPVIGNACTDDATASCAGTRVAESADAE